MKRHRTRVRYDGDISRGIGVEFVEPALRVPTARSLVSTLFPGESTTIREFLTSRWEWPRHLRNYARRHGGVLRLLHDEHQSTLLVVVEVLDRQASRWVTSVEFERRAHAVMFLTVVIDELLAEACTEELEERAALPAVN